MFNIPLHFEDLTRASAAAEWHVALLSQRDATSDELLDRLEDIFESSALFSSSDCPHFSALYNLITRYASLSDAQRQRLIDTAQAVAGRQQQYSSDALDVDQVKLALFLSGGLVSRAGALDKECKTWEKSGKESILESVYNMLHAYHTNNNSNTASKNMTDIHEITSQFLRATMQVIENSRQQVKKHLRPLLARCMDLAFVIDPRQMLATITTLAHALNRNEHEHMPMTLANILNELCDLNPDMKDRFVSQFIRELLQSPIAQASEKSIASFLTDMVDKQPVVMKQHKALILQLFDVDSYVIRNSIVHIIATFIKTYPHPDDPLLDILLQRAQRDVNAFTRSKALQSWIMLVENEKMNVIPNHILPKLVAVATSRLEDRTAAVRKYAAKLLVSLLKHNPFGPVLKRSHFEQRLQQTTEELAAKLKLEDNDDVGGDVDVGEEDKENLSAAQVASNEAGDDRNGMHPEENNQHKQLVQDENMVTNETGEQEIEEEEEEEEEEEQMSDEDRRLLRKKTFYGTAVEYIKTMESAMDTIFNMLRSKSITDVSEAVSVVVCSVQFQFDMAANGYGVRKMLPLVLAREANIREKAVEAFTELLCAGGGRRDDKEDGMIIAKGLVGLIDGASVGEMTCLEELIKHLLLKTDDRHDDTAKDKNKDKDKDKKKKPLINTDVLMFVLWDLFNGRIPGATIQQRVCACIVISLFARQIPQCLTTGRLKILLNVGLNNDFFARWSCITLSHIDANELDAAEDEDRDDDDEDDDDDDDDDDDERDNNETTSDRKRVLLQIVDKLAQLCVDARDLAVIEQTVNAIYCISPCPEAIMSSVIHHLSRRIHQHNPDHHDDEHADDDDAQSQPQSQSQSKSHPTIVSDLCRFFMVIGHTAVKQLVRVEMLVSQLRKKAKSGRGKGGSNGKNKSSSSSNKKGGRGGNNNQVNDDDEDQENEDEEQRTAEADAALEEGERRLVSPTSMLGRYGALAYAVARDEQASSELRTCAVMCLAKLMCIEKRYCQAHLRKFFTVLSSTTTSTSTAKTASTTGAADVRANMITALGDLTVRFPNLIEPWSAHIYKPLRDGEAKVRKNTLMVLTHLILNDMIKVKGNIVELAVCLLDDDDQIKEMSRLFFQELGRKSANNIYNILPDIISCLSNRMTETQGNKDKDKNMDKNKDKNKDKKNNDDVGRLLSSEDFKTIVTFLIPLMDKEKHADGMVEKLCHRFRTSESDTENRHLAYCISMLSISPRGLQKLLDQFKSFSVAIIDDQVFQYLSVAFEKGNKAGNQQANNAFSELTAKVNAVRNAAQANNDKAGEGIINKEDIDLIVQSQSQSQSQSQTETQQEQAVVKRTRSRGKTQTQTQGRARARAKSTSKTKRTTASRRKQDDYDDDDYDIDDGSQNKDDDEENVESTTTTTTAKRTSESATSSRRTARTRKRVVIVEESDDSDEVNDDDDE